MRSWAAGDGGRDSFGDRWPRGQTRGAGMTSGPSGGRPVALPCRSTSGNKENSVRTRHVMLLLAGLLLASTAQAADTDAWKLPIATKTLDNGLTVVVSEDHSAPVVRSEEHTSELQSLMRQSYAVFCLKKKNE